MEKESGPSSVSFSEDAHWKGECACPVMVSMGRKNERSGGKYEMLCRETLGTRARRTAAHKSPPPKRVERKERV